MSESLKALGLRRHQLELQANKERKEFSAHFKPLEKPLSWADKGMDAIQFLKSSPILWAGAFAALAHYKPKLAGKVLAVGWGAVKLLKGAKKII